VARRVEPEPLQHHSLEVRHHLQVILSHLDVGVDDTVRLISQPVLHRLVLDQVRKDPL
jgi:hypothetical protein